MPFMRSEQLIRVLLRNGFGSLDAEESQKH
jgi:hypothetical protein